MSFMVTASRATSSSVGGTGIRSARTSVVIDDTRARIRSTGCNAEPTSRYVPNATSATTIGPPTASSQPTVMTTSRPVSRSAPTSTVTGPDGAVGADTGDPEVLLGTERHLAEELRPPGAIVRRQRRGGAACRLRYEIVRSSPRPAPYRPGCRSPASIGPDPRASRSAAGRRPGSASIGRGTRGGLQSPEQNEQQCTPASTRHSVTTSVAATDVRIRTVHRDGLVITIPTILIHQCGPP